MVKQLGILVLSLSLVMGLSSFDMDRGHKNAKWEKLGSKSVNYKLDKDVIPVGVSDGVFSKLKIAVSGGNLNMHRMVIHYGNGSKEEIELRHVFSQASSSRLIDLKGNKRVIKKIAFLYDTKGLARGKAKVHVYGRH